MSCIECYRNMGHSFWLRTPLALMIGVSHYSKAMRRNGAPWNLALIDVHGFPLFPNMNEKASMKDVTPCCIVGKRYNFASLKNLFKETRTYSFINILLRTQNWATQWLTAVSSLLMLGYNFVILRNLKFWQNER